MQKSLFKKLFVMSLCIVTSAMVIMGAILFVFFRNFWINEKQSLLRSQSLTVEMQLDRMYGVMNYEHQARRMLAAMSDSTGGTMLITDSSGKILSASDASLIGLTIPSYAVESAKSGEYSELGTLGTVLPDDSYVLGKQLEAKNLEDDYIFTCLPASGLRYYLAQIMQLFLISAIIVCIMVFCAVYAVSARLVRPIREMAQAARSMSRGDFTRYIRVDRQDEIGELAIAFNNMTRSLSAGEQMRRGFVANVSHELKTPMTTIAGFIDGILDGTIDENDRDRYLRIVSNEVRRLSRLVVSMLSLSKLESGEMKLSPVRVDLTQLTVDIALGFDIAVASIGYKFPLAPQRISSALHISKAKHISIAQRISIKLYIDIFRQWTKNDIAFGIDICNRYTAYECTDNRNPIFFEVISCHPSFSFPLILPI